MRTKPNLPFRAPKQVVRLARVRARFPAFDRCRFFNRSLAADTSSASLRQFFLRLCLRDSIHGFTDYTSCHLLFLADFGTSNVFWGCFFLRISRVSILGFHSLRSCITMSPRSVSVCVPRQLHLPQLSLTRICCYCVLPSSDNSCIRVVGSALLLLFC